MDKKTECEVVQDLLIGYVDDVLNVESEKIVEKHLIECTNCQKRLEDIKNDIKDSDNSQKNEIDYLKKIRRKNVIKSILMTIGIIVFICLIIYIRKLIIVNSFMSKAEKTLKTNNFYRETTQISSQDATFVTKIYYKDGKRKKVTEIYSNDGVKTLSTEYATVGTDEKKFVDEYEKKVSIEKGELTKIYNREKNLKEIPYMNKNITYVLGMAFYKSIYTDTFSIGKEYYVLKDIFDKSQRWQVWIDKETGLTLREINKEAVTSYYPGTQITKDIMDYVTKNEYEFGVVTDEDVKEPDFTGYTINYVNIDKIIEEAK